jgi:H+/Cl- antiporter ClcA
MHGAPAIAELPGVVLAALATLVFGAVLGPEMPLILLGGGLALLFLRLARRDTPERARSVVAGGQRRSRCQQQPGPARAGGAGDSQR